MDKRSRSIPADELTERARQIAKEVLADRREILGAAEIEIGVFPDIGTVGLIWRGDIADLKVEPAFEAATKITAGLGEFAEAGRPTVQIFGDFGTMGYFPSGPIRFDTF